MHSSGSTSGQSTSLSPSRSSVASTAQDNEPINPTVDLLQEGIMGKYVDFIFNYHGNRLKADFFYSGLLRPTLEGLDTNVANTRLAQEELKKEMEALER